MTRTEFMEELQRSLSGAMGNSAVNGHMRYYQEYFDIQLGSGKGEEEIAGELGNPRLLAKTIIDASKREGRNGGGTAYDEVYEENAHDTGKESLWKQYRMPGWFWAALVLFGAVALVGVVSSVVAAMLPVLFPLRYILMLVRLFRKN